MGNKVVVFDIDGTLTNSKHRNHILEEIDPIRAQYTKEELKADKELKKSVDKKVSEVWMKFHELSKHDEPIAEMIDLVKKYKSQGYKVYAFSGRADEVRDDTVAYFKDLGVEFDLLKMRRAEQRIKSPYLKNAWVNKYIVSEGDEMHVMYEDDVATIDYLKDKKGMNVLHVDDVLEKMESSRKNKPAGKTNKP